MPDNTVLYHTTHCKVFFPIDKKEKGGKLGAGRYEGVLVGYSETSPSVRVWNPWRGERVLNVGGADYDEWVESGWWPGEKRGKKMFAGMESVVFLAELEDGDALAAKDMSTANGDGSPAASDGLSPPPPPCSLPDSSGVDADDLPPLLPTGSGDDDVDDKVPPPRVPRVSSRGNHGVPATRYDEIFEVATDCMNPPIVTASTESEKVDERSAAMEAGLQRLWEKEGFEEV